MGQGTPSQGQSNSRHTPVTWVIPVGLVIVAVLMLLVFILTQNVSPLVQVGAFVVFGLFLALVGGIVTIYFDKGDENLQDLGKFIALAGTSISFFVGFALWVFDYLQDQQGSEPVDDESTIEQSTSPLLPTDIRHRLLST